MAESFVVDFSGVECTLTKVSNELMKAIQIKDYGDSGALNFTDVPLPQPKSTQVQIKIHASGVNFIDTYHRTGLYKHPKGLPLVIGLEGAGEISKIGEEVKEQKVGDNVAFHGCIGAYAEYICVDANRAVSIPENVSTKDAAALMTQGLTAHYLLRSTYEVKEGETILIHAGAGGTGGLMVQIAKIIGATVITTVGTAEKAEIVKSLGADHVINYNEQDFEEEVLKITDNNRCAVVYDGVGKATWEKSLHCVKMLGHLVTFGNASGAVPPINPLTLTKQGSVTLHRPTTAPHLAGDKLHNRCKELFQWVGEGKLKIRIGNEYALSDAAKAQDALTSRSTVGKVLLVP